MVPAGTGPDPLADWHAAVDPAEDGDDTYVQPI
jgi:hypothetical protein